MTEHTGSDVDRLHAHVDRTASRLQRDYRDDRPGAVADLAILRRGVSQRPGADVRVTAITLGDLYSDSTWLPSEPQPAELASHAALTLFAVHQQSHRGHSMHQGGYSLGRSLRLLGKHVGEGARDAVRRRFTALATAETTDETLHHARGLIQQLRSAGIPLDYARFASDLYWLQRGGGDRVRRAWGLDFYRVRHPSDDANDNAETASASALDDEITTPDQKESRS